MRPDITDLLSSWNRTLPGHPDQWMLGPSGKRLWMDYLDPLPGFSGRADFIHKMNLPMLFSVRCVGYAETALHPIRVRWQMNESRLESENAAFSFCERKLITWEDQALSYQTWENKTDQPLTLELVLPEGASLDKPFLFPCTLHGIAPAMVLRSSIPWEGNSMTLQPGEKRAFLLAAAVGMPDEEEEMAASLSLLLEQKDPKALMDEKALAYLRWFENVPDFDCDDPFMVKCWYYRFYILRKNLSEPGLGRLPGRCFYEGRSHRMPKTPYQASGWEFSRLIPLSVPLHVTDARWMKDGAAAKDELRALSRCLDENGVFAVASVDEVRKEYAHYAAWALYQYDLVHPDDDFIREVLPAYKTDARNVYGSARKGDSLQIERTHALTGKEYQPSFWFFTEDRFPRTVRPAKEGYTPLKRVDRSVYTYLNFVGLARLCERVQDADGAWFASEAERIKRDILEKMWDPVSRCFYDLHWETDEKAFVKNIVAFDPLWAGITGEEHLSALEYLLSPLYFALGSGFASTAADCPVFSSNGGWRGDYFKGPHGCMWNGPSWPYTTGIALDVLAKQSKKYGHAYDEAFEKHLKEYTVEHFQHDSNTPCLVEFYDSKTGDPLSEEPDYNHCFYADLIVRHLAGIEPTEQGVSFHPLRTERRYFSLTDLRVRGHRLDVYYQKASGDRYSDLPDGYTVCVDGQRRFQGNTPETAMLILYEINGSTETRLRGGDNMAFFRYIGEENADTRFHDGGLRPIIGVHNVQVMRANREYPEWSQGFGFTYNHAPMLCRWRKTLYLMYLTSPVHEHDGLARVMLTESKDGYTWSFPRVLFPEIPVPPDVYCGKGAEKLPSDAKTVVHHRMGFYIAPNGVLLASTFHGVSPDIHIAPNSGFGMGRVVRRIMEDGELGEIFVLRVNEKAGWKKTHFPYRLFEESEDSAFADACRALLNDRVANGAWWEEERLDDSFFTLKNIKAPSFCFLPDGKIGAIGKMGLTAVSTDRGETWSEPERMEGIFTSMGKCALIETGDGRYAMVYNPSPDGQHRWPLGVIVSEDGYTYDHLACVCGEVPPMRYGGSMKDFGPNYIRGIMPGNDDSPDGYTWLAYSMNKEDIWAARLPASLQYAETEPVHDHFDDPTGGSLERWHIYSPLWAKVSQEPGGLTLRDSDPYDYAKAVRVFPETGQAVIRLSMQAQHLENGELQIDISDAKGMNAAKILLKPDGKVYLRGGSGELPVAKYQNGECLSISLTVDCRKRLIQMKVNDADSVAYPVMCPCRTVERLTLRTGPVRMRPTPENNIKNVCLQDLINSGEHVEEAVYCIHRLDID